MVIAKRILPSGVRSVARVAVGVGAGQVVAILVSPLLTRLYGPDAFGVFTILTGLTTTLAAGATLRFDAAIPLQANERRAREALAAALLSASIVCAVALAIALVFSEPLSHAFSSPTLAPWLWLVPAGAFWFACFDAVSQFAVRRRAYGFLGRRSLTQALTSTGLQAGLGVAGVSGGLPLGQTAAKAVLATTMIRSLGIRCSVLAAVVRTARFRHTVAALRRYPTTLAPAAVLNTLGLQLPFIATGTLYGVGVAGVLGLTQRVLSAPSALLGQAVANVYLGETAARRRTDADGSVRHFLRASGALCLVGAVVFGSLLLMPTSLFETVFGAQWAAAGEYARALCLSLAGAFVVVPTSQSLILLGATGIQLAWDALRLVSTTGSVLVVAALDEDALSAVKAFGAVSFGAYAILWGLCLAALLRAEHRRSGSAS